MKKLKAIIIDDEKHVREGIMLLANWDQYGITDIYEAKDGEEAKSMILKHHPEIIFTDMNMPKIDGIDLLKWIHTSGFTSKTIVVSGYDDFNYMRNAIAYGSFDYILKPIEPEILNETLERAVTEWHKQETKRKSSEQNNKAMNEARSVYWDHLFTGLLDKSFISNDTKVKIHQEFKVDLTLTQQYTISLFSVRCLLSSVYEGDRDLAFFTVLNICNEITQLNKSGVCFRNINKDDEVVVLLWKQDEIETMNKKIKSALQQISKSDIIIAIGKTSQQLDMTYHTALQTMLTFDLLSTDKKELIKYQETTAGPLFHLLDYMEDIMWTLQSGRIENLDKVLDGIFNMLKSDYCISYEQIMLWEDHFKILRKNWLKEYNVSKQTSFYKGSNYWENDGSFSYSKFMSEKRKEFHELIEILYTAKYQKEKSSIQEIESYLRKNYDKDITLQEIADKFYLSREYISRRFKQEYHETVTNYLTAIRIEKAKELLNNPHLKVYEISFKVGYQNEKYFSKVFKKIVGLTPNEYRSQVLDK
ncbi:response regulator transcription factor [Metabacillus litoralis]|uniref:response regulator transcription factor n=1 Tax=Metabacillus litoralis TaxID=152268 RepID=UPI0011BDB211|nr:response regulator [Metabacillus litoralis]